MLSQQYSDFQPTNLNNLNGSDDHLELQHMIGYNGKYLKTIQFHPKNENKFIYCIGGLVIIEDIKDKHQQDFLRGHDMEIQSFAVSNSGKLIASGQKGTIYSKTADAPVCLWDTQSLQILNVFKGLLYGVTNLSFSPDDMFLAATGLFLIGEEIMYFIKFKKNIDEYNVMIIWNLQDFTIVHNKILEVPITQISWHYVQTGTKYNKYTLVTAHGCQIFINLLEFNVATIAWGLQSYSCQLPSSGLVRNFTTSCINQQGDYFYVGTTAGEICVYNIQNKVFKAALPISNNGVLSFAITKDCIFVGSGDGKLKRLVGRQEKWSLDAELQLQGKVVSLALSPDQKELLAGTSAGYIYKVKTATLDAMVHTEGNVAAINDLQFQVGQNQFFGTIDDSATIYVWDSQEFNLITKCIPAVQNKVITDIQGTSLAFSEQNEIAGGFSDGFVRCYEISKKQFANLKWEIVNAHRGRVTTIYIDSLYILTGGNDAQIRIWSRKTRQLVHQISIHTKEVAKILPDIKNPQILHSCSIDKTILTYNLKSEKKVILHFAKNGVLLDMTQRKDHENELITCGFNTPITFWDCDVVDPIDQIEYPSKLHSAEVSPSGKYLAIGSETGEVAVFQINQKQFLGKYIGHTAPVNRLKWTPDEKQILSVSSDSSICAWNFFP